MTETNATAAQEAPVVHSAPVLTLHTEEAGLPELTGKELWSGREIKKARQLRAVLAPHDAAVWKVER